MAQENLLTLKARSALSQRGWVYQESILSRRSLYFGARQLYWKCPCGFDSLDGLYPRSPSYDSSVWAIHEQLGSNDTSAIQSEYYDIVSEYSMRALTYSKGKLPAFSGLTGRYHDAFGGEYLAGVWSTDLHRGLLWNLWYSVPSSSYSPVQPYRAPSWSWTSVEGNIRWGQHEPHAFLRLHSCHVRPLNNRNPYGEVDPIGGVGPCGESLPASVIVSGPTMRFVGGSKFSSPNQ